MSESEFPNHLAAMLAADGAVVEPSVRGELLREQFTGDRRIRQTESRWVADGRFPGSGHWEVIEETCVDPPPA